jgi:PKD repeat protein
MSKKLQKITNKPSMALHSDDWNSRFWIGKIPEYKPKSAAGVQNPKLRHPNRLPKIQSATNMTEESPIRETLGVSNTHETDISIKTDQITEIKKTQSSFSEKSRPKLVSQAKPKTTILTSQKSPSALIVRPKLSETRLKPGENRRNMLKKSENPQNVTSKSAEPHSSKILLPKISPTAKSTLKSEGKTAAEYLETEEIRETSSESEESDEEGLSQMTLSIFTSFLASGVNLALEDLSQEAVDEALLAYLTLSASKILYSYIKEALDDLIPVIAKAAYNESKEKEPSELRDEIAGEVGEVELRRLVQQLNVDLIANVIAGEYLQLLPLEGYVVECVHETEVSNREKVLQIFHFLIDSIVEEEWVEVLAEDVINSLRIERNWNLLPPNLQKEVGKSQKGKILETLAERIYFDLLNDVVAGVWVETLVVAVVNDDEGFEGLMPVPKFVSKKNK